MAALGHAKGRGPHERSECGKGEPHRGEGFGQHLEDRPLVMKSTLRYSNTATHRTRRMRFLRSSFGSGCDGAALEGAVVGVGLCVGKVETRRMHRSGFSWSNFGC